MKALLLIPSLFLASCITTLKPTTPNDSRLPINKTSITKLNGDYNTRSKNNSVISLDWALTFNKDISVRSQIIPSKVTIAAIDERHIKVMLYNGDSLIKTRVIKGKIKDDYFTFKQRSISPFWFIINGFGKNKTRLGLLNTGDLIVDSRSVIVATLIILPFSGGRKEEYNMIFNKQVGSR